MTLTEPPWTDQVQAFTGLVSMVLWAIYVYYTIRTFREIKQQTELQMDAFLIVTADVVSRAACKDMHMVNSSVQALSNKWFGILDKNLQEALQSEDRYLKLTFKNRGKSDVVSWAITAHLVVEAGPILAATNITGETCEWIVKSDGSQHIVAPGESIDVTIAPIGCFPVASINWSIVYTDSRQKKSESFAGDVRKKELNRLAMPPSQ